MTDKAPLTEPFFKNSGLTLETATYLVTQGLQGADYGELYQEITASEGLAKTGGKYTAVSIGNSSAGFGFRVGQGEKVGYAYAADFNAEELKTAIAQARKVLDTTLPPAVIPKSGHVAQQLYPAENPMDGMSLTEKIASLDALEAYARSLDPAITNVSLSYNASAKTVHIITADGQSLVDSRPMATLSIGITVTDTTGKKEIGSALVGGRVTCKDVFNEVAAKKGVADALQQAKTLLIAEEAPAGIMDVVLSPGWSAVLLHEAVGHGLEGDFNRRDISVYSGKIGQQIASAEVTIIDCGNLAGERGSLHFDDEGTPTQENVLIENGVLKGYMQDRQNAQLMGVAPTGNGRRESYEDAPMPRMTNTYFKNGTHDPADIIKSVKDGLYISDMANGQVDITSGQFNMNAKLAYRIRDGKLCEPIKGASITGKGADIIKSITMIGNDLEIAKSSGNCGKNGQSVVVGCGQPTIRVSNMTVGGSKAK